MKKRLRVSPFNFLFLAILAGWTHPSSLMAEANCSYSDIICSETLIQKISSYKPDILVVLGSRVLGANMKRRVAAVDWIAAQLEYPPHIVLTGGNPVSGNYSEQEDVARCVELRQTRDQIQGRLEKLRSGSPFALAESEAMCSLLLGFEKQRHTNLDFMSTFFERIRLESASDSTLKNGELTVPLLYGLAASGKTKSLLVTTTEGEANHGYRALQAFRRYLHPGSGDTGDSPNLELQIESVSWPYPGGPNGWISIH